MIAKVDICYWQNLNILKFSRRKSKHISCILTVFFNRTSLPGESIGVPF